MNDLKHYNMKRTEQNNDKGNSLSTKWVYVIIAAMVLGFGAYGYFKVKQWVRYYAIEQYEKPITDYTIAKVYADDHKPQRHRGNSDDDEEEKTPDYYMEVSYQGKDYKLEIEENTYLRINNSEKVTLYYDKEGDEVFVAGTGGSNLLVAILIGIVVIIVIFFLLIRLLIKSLKKKSRAKPN